MQVAREAEPLLRHREAGQLLAGQPQLSVAHDEPVDADHGADGPELLQGCMAAGELVGHVDDEEQQPADREEEAVRRECRVVTSGPFNELRLGVHGAPGKVTVLPFSA